MLKNQKKYKHIYIYIHIMYDIICSKTRNKYKQMYTYYGYTIKNHLKITIFMRTSFVNGGFSSKPCLTTGG